MLYEVITASIHETVFENDGDPITLMDQIADESHRITSYNVCYTKLLRERLQAGEYYAEAGCS